MSSRSIHHRDAIVDLLNQQTRALHVREIAARLHVDDAGYAGFLRELSDLANTGIISPHSGQRYRSKGAARTGRDPERQGVLTVNPRGFGFVASIGFEDDLYVPEERLGGAMHGDIVVARLV